MYLQFPKKKPKLRRDRKFSGEYTAETILNLSLLYPNPVFFTHQHIKFKKRLNDGSGMTC